MAKGARPVPGPWARHAGGLGLGARPKAQPVLSTRRSDERIGRAGKPLSARIIAQLSTRKHITRIAFSHIAHGITSRACSVATGRCSKAA